MELERDVLVSPTSEVPVIEGEIVTAIRTLGTLIRHGLPPPPADLRDNSDWPFMACAQAAGCPVITGNVRDFPAALGVRVMTAREWMGRRAPI